MTRKVFRAAFYSSLPVLMGYMAMGAAAGILLAETMTSELPRVPFWAFFSSAVTISGALQFLMAQWAKVQMPLMEIALLTLCLNMRYAMYGISLLERFKNIPWYKKYYFIWAMTDETYALEVENRTPPGESSISYCFAVAMLNHIYWICGVVCGSLLGAKLPFDSKGIDFAMTALFLVVLTDQCREKQNRIPALTGIVAAVAARAVFPTDKMLIPAMVLMITGFILLRKKLDKEDKHHEQ